MLPKGPFGRFVVVTLFILAIGFVSYFSAMWPTVLVSLAVFFVAFAVLFYLGVRVDRRFRYG